MNGCEGEKELTDEASQADRRLSQSIGKRYEVRRSHSVDEYLRRRGEYGARCRNA